MCLPPLLARIRDPFFVEDRLHLRDASELCLQLAPQLRRDLAQRIDFGRQPFVIGAEALLVGVRHRFGSHV